MNCSYLKVLNVDILQANVFFLQNVLCIDNKKWLTNDIVDSCQTKNKLYYKFIRNPTPENRNNYKVFRNALTKAIRATKHNFYYREFSKKDMKSTWSMINDLIKGNKDKKSNLNSLFENGLTITNKPEICEIFNDFFVNIGPQLTATIPTSNSTFLDKMPDAELQSAFFNPTDIHEVVLVHIINISFAHGIVPSRLKIARITPIFKGGDGNLKTNYRPISILPCISKIFEKLVFNRVMNYLNHYKILSDTQFVFLPGRSTSQALVNFSEEILTSFEERKLTCGIFLDLSKAFDTLDHGISLAKLNNYGLRGNINNWFRSYLSSRFQYVYLDNGKSSLRPISCGVPQGSIL